MKYRWPLSPLSEVLAERTERPDPVDLASGVIRIVSKIGFNDGIIRLRSEGDTRTGMILIRPGDLVVSGINAIKGAIAIYDSNATQPIAATIHYSSYIPKKEKVDARYLWWLLRSNTFREILNEYLPRGIKTELKAKRFLPVPVPFPSLEEQRRIVARTEALAAKIEEARELRKKAVEELGALLDAMSYAVFRNPRNPNKTVGDIANVTKLAGFEYTKYFTNAPPGTVKVVRAGNVRNNGLDLSNAMTIPKEISDALPRSQLKPEDVIMTFIGAKIGDVTYIRHDHPCLHCGPNVAKLTPNEQVSHLYLVKVLQSYLVQNQIKEITKSTAQPNLSMKTIRQLKVPVPPLSTQSRIVAYLDNLQAKMDALKRLQSETAAELDALLPSILDKAFKGELA